MNCWTGPRTRTTSPVRTWRERPGASVPANASPPRVPWVAGLPPGGDRVPHAPRAVECENAAPRARERCRRSVSTSTLRDDRIFFRVNPAWIMPSGSRFLEHRNKESEGRGEMPQAVRFGEYGDIDVLEVR